MLNASVLKIHSAISRTKNFHFYRAKYPASALRREPFLEMGNRAARTTLRKRMGKVAGGNCIRVRQRLLREDNETLVAALPLPGQVDLTPTPHALKYQNRATRKESPNSSREITMLTDGRHSR